MARFSSRRKLLVGVGAAVGVAGCLDDTGSAGPDGDGDSDGPDDGGAAAGDDQGDEAATEDLEWREATLEDVRTGESFSIAGIDDTVLLHTFASYCPTCGSQETELAAVEPEREDVTVVALAITGGDTAEGVRDHAAENGYDWRFAMASEPLTGALVEEFGREMAIHGESPVVAVCPDGSTERAEKVASETEIRRALEEGCGDGTED
ncbi:TlpA family protein disulfide reductase [Halopiger goleimassiliensis]|uniref:TlpA family protein disulfide reductase n=1 Tax=Halopiger goleimassiliensis TaxID=1293048 RepID=UPI0006779959|nr:hypothetical protein [Halopiger goleimassiliensis]